MNSLREAIEEAKEGKIIPFEGSQSLIIDSITSTTSSDEKIVRLSDIDKKTWSSLINLE